MYAPTSKSWSDSNINEGIYASTLSWQRYSLGGTRTPTLGRALNLLRRAPAILQRAGASLVGIVVSIQARYPPDVIDNGGRRLNSEQPQPRPRNRLAHFLRFLLPQWTGSRGIREYNNKNHTNQNRCHSLTTIPIWQQGRASLRRILRRRSRLREAVPPRH